MGTDHSDMGTDHSGMGTDHSGMGTDHSDMGTDHSGMGTDHSGMGTDHSRHAVHLEVVVKANKEGERDGGEDPLLIEGVLHLLQFDHLLLVQDLEGVVGLGLLVLNQHHTAKRPRT